MSRFFPHSAYAEDQPYPRAILTTHVMTRGFQSGALVGSVIAVPSYYYFQKPSSVPPRSFPTILLRSTATGSIIGTGLVTVALAALMWNKEPIEWADRSWRLLENRGQVELDDWSYGGAVLGAAGVLFSASGLNTLGWRGALGGSGLGSLLGAGGYIVWRHGINGGKRGKEASM
jgi:Protein of unknown function (DUF1757)